MKKQTKSALGKIALILGGAAVLDGVAGSGSRSANVATPAKADTPILTAERFKELISSDQELQAVLRSMFPQTSVQDVVTNINNSYTLHGVQYQNFGSSLVQNGAFEFNNLSNWTGITRVTDNLNLGARIAETTATFSNSYKFPVRQDRLYFYTYNAKGNVSGQIAISFRTYDSSLTMLNKLNGSTSTNDGVKTLTTGFSNFKGYLGGQGNLNSTLAPNAILASVVMGLVTSTICELSGLIIKEVSLGDPVPSNLPWLPTGQMVYDITTWEVGIYNGTSVVWFAI